MVFTRAFLPEMQGVILSHLSTPELKNCALVAPDWNREATRLLWHSIKFKASESIVGDIARASEKFSRFINELTLQAQRDPYVRRLALDLDGFVHHQESHSSIETAEACLTVPWELITRAFKPMYRLQYLDLYGSVFSPRLASTICQALSGAPICAIYSSIPIPRVLDYYANWVSTIKDVLLNNITDSQELPRLPHLRFIASDMPEVVANFMITSPVESICMYGVRSSKSELAAVINAINAQTTTGISTLRSVYLRQFLNETMTLRELMNSLESPTLEHIHLVLDGVKWSESFDLADYIASCLEDASNSMSRALPSLRSLRFELYDPYLDIIPSQCLPPERGSSYLITEAGLRFSMWLQRFDHPALLEHIEVYSLGSVPDTPPKSAYRIVDIEAIRSPAIPGRLLESSDL
ncbi:hypothetical protein DL93DRAFT_409544 [Clavulina sp. PMI_390]|nr:hypothetical protein DL93DRAFT_409544 [Clavulina sp. PMI_390]